MQRLFSGIQPSGNLHLGNYLGAIKQWVELQDQYEAFFCVVDLHAITVPQDPAELRKKILEVAKIYLAAGINPEKSTLFVQSQISGHTQLAWVLNTIATMGELGRMTQFKDKTKSSVKYTEQDIERFKSEWAKNGLADLTEEQYKSAVSILEMETSHRLTEGSRELASVGLFDYPVLMAADILLYDTAVVPVGEDQKQHVELTRDLAERFNKRFGETFVVPEPRIYAGGGRIMGLDDPTKKMSKSAASEYNYIGLTDDADTVRRKIKKAVTDSDSEIDEHTENKPALKNLLNIYSFVTDRPIADIIHEYRGKGYGEFKTGLAEEIVKFLMPFQGRLASLTDEAVMKILEDGREKAKALAVAKMRQVYGKVGFLTY